MTILLHTESFIADPYLTALKMELTFVNDFGQSFVVEIDPNMELENVMALLEAEASGSMKLSSSSFHRF